MQAREVFKVKPEGNYVFIKGSTRPIRTPTSCSPGSMEVLKAAIDAGKIKNVGEAYTDGWKPDNAQKNMEQFLTANDNKVDAVVAANDGTAGGVVAALTRRASPAGAGLRPGRRPRGAQPRRARHPDRLGVEGRARARQGRRPKSPSQLADGKKLDRDQGRRRSSTAAQEASR